MRLGATALSFIFTVQASQSSFAGESVYLTNTNSQYAYSLGLDDHKYSILSIYLPHADITFLPRSKTLSIVIKEAKGAIRTTYVAKSSNLYKAIATEFTPYKVSFWPGSDPGAVRALCATQNCPHNERDPKNAACSLGEGLINRAQFRDSCSPNQSRIESLIEQDSQVVQNYKTCLLGALDPCQKACKDQSSLKCKTRQLLKALFTKADDLKHQVQTGIPAMQISCSAVDCHRPALTGSETSSSESPCGSMNPVLQDDNKGGFLISLGLDAQGCFSKDKPGNDGFSFDEKVQVTYYHELLHRAEFDLAPGTDAGNPTQSIVDTLTENCASKDQLDAAAKTGDCLTLEQTFDGPTSMSGRVVAPVKNPIYTSPLKQAANERAAELIASSGLDTIRISDEDVNRALSSETPVPTEKWSMSVPTNEQIETLAQAAVRDGAGQGVASASSAKIDALVGNIVAKFEPVVTAVSEKMPRVEAFSRLVESQAIAGVASSSGQSQSLNKSGSPSAVAVSLAPEQDVKKGALAVQTRGIVGSVVSPSIQSATQSPSTTRSTEPTLRQNQDLSETIVRSQPQDLLKKMNTNAKFRDSILSAGYKLIFAQDKVFAPKSKVPTATYLWNKKTNQMEQVNGN